jgi:zinc transporter
VLKTLNRNPGLLWGLAVQGGKATNVIDDTAADILSKPQDWCWMHFALSDHRARRFLEGFEAVPARARALLLEGETRPQLHLGSGCAWGVLPDFEKDFAEGDHGEGSVAFYLDAEHLITTRRHPMRVVGDVHERIKADGPPPAPVDVFVMLNERFVEIAEKRFAVFARWLDRLEDKVLGEQGDLDKTGLGSVRREVARFHREFAGLRAAYHRAMNMRTPVPDNPVSPRLPELLQAAEDFDRDAAALTERARLLYEEIDTRIAAATNRSLQTLTIISTLLLPPTFIVGAFGMNVPAIPWAGDHSGFWWAFGLCAVCVAACWALLRRYGIL